jgi:hypothetical protein
LSLVRMMATKRLSHALDKLAFHHRALGAIHALRQGDSMMQRNDGPVEPGRPPELRTSNVEPRTLNDETGLRPP